MTPQLLFLGILVSPSLAGWGQQGIPEGCTRLPTHMSLSVEWSPDGRLLASGNGHVIELIRVVDRKLVHQFTQASRLVRSFAFSPDNKLLAAAVDSFNRDGSRRGEVILWDLATKQESAVRLWKEWAYAVSVAFSLDSKTLAIGGFELDEQAGAHSRVMLLELATRKARHFLLGEGQVSSLLFCPDRKHLVVGWGRSTERRVDGEIQLWDLEAGERRYSVTAHRDRRMAKLACSPDGRTLASGGEDGLVRLWELATGRERLALRHFSEVQCVAFSSTGEHLVTGTWHGGLYLWSLSSGKELQVIDANGRNGGVWGVAFSPSGDTIAAAAYDVALLCPGIPSPK